MKKTIVLVYISYAAKEIHPAIYYLKEYAINQGLDAHVVTKVYSRNKSAKRMIKEILKHNPVLVGFSTYIWNMDSTLRAIRVLKRLNPGVPIILGGPEASYNAKRILKDRSDIEAVVFHEGEVPFTKLAKHYVAGNTEISGIKGILYREKGVIKKTGQSPPLDLNTVQSPYLSGSIPNIRNKTLAYETSRGCPFKCAYCSYNAGSYARMRFFPLAQVIREISHLLKQEPKKIDIVDDNFNIYESRAIKILKHMRRFFGGTNVTIFLRADIWRLGENLVRLLAHRNIFCTIGVQSLNESTLTKANRLHRREDLDFNIRLLKKHGVNFTLQFIIGLPGDRYGDVKDMINWAFLHNPYGIHLQTLRINPQTDYEKNASRYGILYRDTPPYTIRRTNTMNPAQLSKAKKLALHFESVYKNKSLRKRLTEIHLKTQLPASEILEKALRKRYH